MLQAFLIELNRSGKPIRFLQKNNIFVKMAQYLQLN